MLQTVFINNIPFLLQFASTDKELEKGLMYVKHLPELSGMLFIFPSVDNHSIWMKNTYIPLDILFINDDYTIVHTYQCAKPFDLTGISTPVKCKYIIEINCGIINKFNIKKGDKIYI
jgi:uncharacterized membrane protein (UPF0127 family)